MQLTSQSLSAALPNMSVRASLRGITTPIKYWKWNWSMRTFGVLGLSRSFKSSCLYYPSSFSTRLEQFLTSDQSARQVSAKYQNLPQPLLINSKANQLPQSVLKLQITDHCSRILSTSKSSKETNIMAIVLFARLSVLWLFRYALSSQWWCWHLPFSSSG